MVTSIVAPVGAAGASDVAADDSGGTFDAFTDDEVTVAGDDTTEATTASTHSSNESTDDNETEGDSSTLDTPESTTTDSDEDSLEEQRIQDESDDLVGTQISSSVEPITECRILNEPGEYELQNDLQDSETCLRVEADGVTIDGNGHTISSSDSSDSYGIAVGDVDAINAPEFEPRNVHVHNVTLEGWDIGLTARSVEQLTVEGVTAENSASDGIRVRDGVGVEISEVKVANNGGDGISFGDVHDSTVEYVTASENEGAGALFLDNSDNTNVTVAHSVVTDNGQDGIRVTGDEMFVANNTATGNDGNGISDLGTSVNNTYTHNTVIDNGDHGIEIDYTTEGTVVEYTNATGNADSGIRVDTKAENVTVVHNHLEGNQHGVYVASGTDNWIENNTAVASSATGFRAENGASNTTFIDNRAIDNEQQGILIEGSSNDAQLVDNTIRGSGDRGVDVRGSDGATLSGDTILDSGNWDVRAGDYLDSSTTGAEIENVSASDVTIGTTAGGEVTLDFVATDIAFGSETESSAPEDLAVVGTMLDVEAHPDDGALEVTFHYEDGNVDDTDTLGVWVHDGDEWSETGSVDPNERTATATTTEDGTIGLFGERDAKAPETGTLEGDVTGDGSPLDGATVTVTDDAGVTETVETGGDGAYELTLPVGSYEVVVSADGYDESLADLEIEAGETTVHDVPLESEPGPGTLAGVVTDAESGDGIQWIHVSATSPDTTDMPDVSTDESGSYEVELTPGTYEVTFYTEGGQDFGYAPKSLTGVEITEEETTELDVELHRTSGPGGPGLEPVEPGTVTFDPAEPAVDETVTADASELSPEAGDAEGYLWAFDGTERGELVPDRFTTAPVTEHSFGSAGEHDVVVMALSADAIDQLAAQLPETACDISQADECHFDEDDWTDGGDMPGSDEPGNGGIDPAEVALALETITVIEEPEANLVLYGATVEETAVEHGDEVVLSATLINTGDLNATETIELTADELDSDSVNTVAEHAVEEFEPGNLETIELRWETSDVVLDDDDLSVEFDLYLGDLFVDTVSVEDRESDIQVIAASASADEVVAGEEMYATGSIYQAGTANVSQEIDLTAVDTEDENNEIDLATSEHSLEPGWYHLGAINETFTFEDPGTYELFVGDRSAGTVEVIERYSDIQVIAASASTDEIVAGEEEFYATGSIYQNGTIEGSETINLTAEHVGTGNTTTVGTQDDVNLAPGFYHLGALNISGTLEEPGTHNLTLGDRSMGTIEVIEAYSDIEVIAASVDADEVVQGEEFYAVGSIYQNGTIAEPEDVALNATPLDDDGDPIDDVEPIPLGVQEDVNLTPGFYHLGAVNISASFETEEADPGTYRLELGDRNAGEIEVIEAYSDIEVIAASVDADEVVQGEEFYAVGSIYQNGTVDKPQDVALNATPLNDDGDPIKDGTVELGVQEDVNLAPGFYHLGAVNISASFETKTTEPGTYRLELGDRNAGEIEVIEAYSDIQVIAASADAMNVSVGEEFHVVGSIYQNGTIDGSERIALNATPLDDDDNLIEDETVELGVQEDVTLEPGYYHLGALNISAEFEEGDLGEDDSGEFALTLGDRNAGTISVEQSPSDIQVIAASLSEIEVLEDEQLNVTGSVYQNGTGDVSQTINLTATNQDTGEERSLGNESVTLEAGYYHLDAIEIDFAIDEPGTYDLYLDDHRAGELEVIERYSDIEVIAASADADEVVAGEESFYTVGSIYQNGTVDGPEDVALNATPLKDDGSLIEGETFELASQEDVTLESGFYHLGAVNISASFDADQTGTYRLDLGERYAGTVEVLPAASDIEVIAASASTDELVAGEELYAVGSVYQNGTIEGPQTLNLTAERDGDGKEIDLGGQTMNLTPGFYHLGALNISDTIDEPGTYDLTLGDRPAGTVEVLPAASDIEVIAASVSTDEIVAGEEFYAQGSVYQNGTIEGPQTLNLTAEPVGGGEEIDLGGQTMNLTPGFYHLGALNISDTIDEPGTYELTLGDRPAGTVEVLPAVSDIEVIAASASADEVAVGGSFYAVGSIYQNGTVDDPEDVALTATALDEDGDPVDGEPLELGVQEDVTLQPGFYHLGAVNVSASFEADQVGTYRLDLGDRNAGTIEVRDPIVEPSIVDVDGHSSAIDPDFDERTVTYANDDVTVDLDVESDFPLESAVVQITFLETNFFREYDAEPTDDGTLTVDLPTDGTDRIGDDGAYELRAIAEDERGTVGYHEWDGILLIDTERPTMSVSIEDVDRENATVVVESDAPLSSVPTVDVDFDEASTLTSDPTVSLTSQDSSNTTFEGTLPFDESGEYTVTVTGTDRAGNEDTDQASVVVNTDLVLENGQLTFEGVNADITFDVSNVHEDLNKDERELFLAVSESTVNANLDDSDLGVGFLQTELPGLLEAHLEGAEIEMTIEGTDVPDGVGADDLTLNNYDGDGEWDVVEDAAISSVGEDFSVVADVPGFSTYGVLVNDTEPPELESVWPADGETVSTSDETIEVAFEYDDALSGVNASAVTMELNNVDVTHENETYIHSTGATHEFDIEYGNEYTVSVTVDDEAGNGPVTFETTFTVEEKDDSDDSDDSGGSGSSGGSSGSSGSSPAPTPSDPDDDGTDEGEPDDGDRDSGADDGDGIDTDSSDDGGSGDPDDSPAETDDDSPDDASGDDDSIPGFGTVIALLAIAVLLSVALRHRA